MANTGTETLQYQHEDFGLYISCDSLESSRKKLLNTYSQRGLSFSDIPLNELKVEVGGCSLLTDSEGPFSVPFFFENRQYWFEIEFENHVDSGSATVNHKHKLLDQSFTLNPRRNVLQAMINFGNDVGKCEFSISYTVDGVKKSLPVIFNVLATKMVQHQDLAQMNQKIDSTYPLWRYSISGKTTQYQGKSRRHSEKFELFWLAQIERLFDDLEQGLKRVLLAPHNRLQSFTVHQKLDRINKKLNSKQQEHARELVKSKRLNTRMQLTHQRLNVDTPENRFIKMVLQVTKKNLSKIIKGIATDKGSSVSTSFMELLSLWQGKIARFSQHQLWQEVGSYDGVYGESKVLQQGTGYSKVYKNWQQLKYYLNGTKGDAQLSIKSIADIYEVWCFLEVKSIIESLGFEEQKKSISTLKKVQFEKQFPKDEMAAAFVFVRSSDGVVIELAHEPSFTPKGKTNRTWLANQRPDIVLRVTLTNQESFLILFDAKYRIDTSQFKEHDGVPEDALNQMHRYRDAIIHQQELQHERPFKSRPVMGAFALYPGFFNKQEIGGNPYDEAINEIGIGAFALLPSEGASHGHNVWLRHYLQKKLGHIKAQTTYAKPKGNDYYFVEDASRISPYGMRSVRHHGLTMIAPVNEIDRSSDYLKKARTGTLTHYHTKLMATNRQNIHRNIIREIRYLLLTVRDEMSDDFQYGKYLYRVESVKLVPRKDIPSSITGKEEDSSDTSSFWLFTFSSSPVLLSQAFRKPYAEHFQFKLTKVQYLDQISQWEGVTGSLQLYTELDENW
ncbi:DUF2357 domain-containing protein [Vibrio breoganii]|uniref:DUF2357 domain-containing protein n=1 Tax=Vibrio breoganii TaxID=553239 RepID=UPI000C815F78|nr:DUF2357 domain-containing protein [Vibrio breoganii]PMI22498.1 hypothetical protein BCU49_18280 [Vibrio breoganii]PML37687.1 hypothetical protein BCT77_00775 [Vibrio breoganii]PMO74584.1 hypothetical protein BCT02_01550 [Vibrio breoganii]PMO93435.1 hypothetical protein BCS99_00435 [Vibrio breoganii]PMP04545.1 hypothetical protein BCS95_05355 [Vibrio breoganii]